MSHFSIVKLDEKQWAISVGESRVLICGKKRIAIRVVRDAERLLDRRHAKLGTMFTAPAAPHSDKPGTRQRATMDGLGAEYRA